MDFLDKAKEVAEKAGEKLTELGEKAKEAAGDLVEKAEEVTKMDLNRDGTVGGDATQTVEAVVEEVKDAVTGENK